MNLFGKHGKHNQHDPTQKLAERLDADFKWARETLVILTEPGAGPPTLPPEELAEARGLAFASVHKGGAFVSGTSGHGFVIRKLHSDPVLEPMGPARWSAPLFFTVHSVGMGLTFGAALVESMVLLNSEDAVTAFTKDESKMDTDIGVTTGEVTPAKHAGRTAPREATGGAGGSQEYAVASGALVDVSLKESTVKLIRKTVAAVYGENTKPEDVLSGRENPPNEAKILYDELHRVLDPVDLRPEHESIEQTPDVLL